MLASAQDPGLDHLYDVLRMLPPSSRKIEARATPGLLLKTRLHLCRVDVHARWAMFSGCRAGMSVRPRLSVTLSRLSGPWQLAGWAAGIRCGTGTACRIGVGMCFDGYSREREGLRHGIYCR
jgi:hypothetical protein